MRGIREQGKTKEWDFAALLSSTTITKMSVTEKRFFTHTPLQTTSRVQPVNSTGLAYFPGNNLLTLFAVKFIKSIKIIKKLKLIKLNL